MTSEVMEEEEMIRRFREDGASAKRSLSQAIHHDTRGFICGEKVSMRSSCSPTSSGVPNVVSVENNRRVAFFQL